MNIKLLCVATGILLLLAILNWPYGYYVFLRIIVFISSIIVAIRFYNSKLNSWAYVFAAIAFIFNPLFPIYLTKSAWAPIDLISAILFFLASSSVKKR